MSEKPLDDLDESDLNSWLKDWPNDDGTAKSPDDLRAEPYHGTDRISDENQTEPATKPQFVPVPFEPDSFEETTRKSGLAWSAGIAFFSSIAFTLLLGWGADLLFGSSPWGIVGGIVLGSIVGFIQFFRITSQIFDDGRHRAKTRPLFDAEEDDD